MADRKERIPLLEQGLLMTLQAIDNQVARSMARTPAAREIHGVQKWQPMDERVERIAAFVLQAFGDEQIALESLLVLSRALIRSLSMLMDELGRESLGDVRTRYCEAALDEMARTLERSLLQLQSNLPLT